MALNLLNLYSLIFALFDKIGIMNKQMDTMRINTYAMDALNSTHMPTNMSEFSTDGATVITDSARLMATTISNAVGDLNRSGQTMWDTFVSSATTLIPPNCRQIEVDCMKSTIFNKTTVTSLALLTTTILPEIWSRLNTSTTFDYYGSGWNPENTTNEWLTNVSTWLPPDLDFNSTIDFENFTSENLSTMFTTEYSDEYSRTESTATSAAAATATATTPTDAPSTLKTEPINEPEEDYEYDDESEDGERRRKRDTLNLFDEIQNYDWQLTEDLENQTNANDANFTEFISSTISTFMENFTMTPDEWNSTYVSEMWTTFVSTIDETAWTEPDEDEPKICYEIVCDPTDSFSDFTEEDYTTFGIDERTTATEITTPQPTTYSFTCPTMPIMPATTIAPLNVSKKKITGKNLTAFIYHMDTPTQMNLRKLCWETMFGQELVKLTVLDLVCNPTFTFMVYCCGNLWGNRMLRNFG